MTKNKKYFSYLNEKDMQFQIELGYDGATRGVSIDSFQRELGNHLHLKDVLYVPSLKQNLILCVKQIGLKMKNLYKFQLETGAALSSKARSAQSREVMVEKSRALRESLEQEKFGVPKKKPLKMEPLPVSQFESQLVSSWANQQDDEKQSPGRVEETK